MLEVAKLLVASGHMPKQRDDWYDQFGLAWIADPVATIDSKPIEGWEMLQGCHLLIGLMAAELARQTSRPFEMVISELGLTLNDVIPTG